jgi:hypothetical protein
LPGPAHLSVGEAIGPAVPVERQPVHRRATMTNTTARCDHIVALIDACLAEMEDSVVSAPAADRRRRLEHASVTVA